MKGARAEDGAAAGEKWRQAGSSARMGRRRWRVGVAAAKRPDGEQVRRARLEARPGARTRLPAARGGRPERAANTHGSRDRWEGGKDAVGSRRRRRSSVSQSVSRRRSAGSLSFRWDRRCRASSNTRGNGLGPERPRADGRPHTSPIGLAPKGVSVLRSRRERAIYRPFTLTPAKAEAGISVADLASPLAVASSCRRFGFPPGTEAPDDSLRLGASL